MSKRNQHRIEQKGEYLFISVRKDISDFKVDNAMQYLVYKVPNYKNWVTDEILADYGKLQKYLDTHSPDNDYKTGGVKLPEGKWNCLGIASVIDGEWDELLADYGLKPNTTLVLKQLK